MRVLCSICSAILYRLHIWTSALHTDSGAAYSLNTKIIAHSSAIAGTFTCQGVVLTLSQICHKFKMKVILKPKKLSILFMCIPSRVLGINLKDTQRRHEPIQSVYVTKDKYLYNITEVLYTL